MADLASSFYGARVLKCRATPAAIQTLLLYGNVVVPEPPLFSVHLRHPPPIIFVAMTPYSDNSALVVPAIRVCGEPKFTDEMPAPWHVVGDWQPCPVCGATLAWDEAGHVPGARVCLGPAGHRLVLRSDGRLP